ncbi:MAG TPA: DUF4238 domain-containing protein [Tahibacter sp.]|nr:DUF4238 domain-containing protein [Tahibacter sp.]
MTDKPTKNQHWVPKFYLAKFATPETRHAKKMDDRRISVLNKQLELVTNQPTSVRNFCGNRYLYSPLDVNGNRSMDVEDLLNRMETRVSGIWDELATGNPDLSDPNLRGILAEFVATLHLRNKVIFDDITSAMASRDKLYGGPSKDVLAKLGPDSPDPNDPGRFFVHTLLNGIERIAAGFSRKRWRILCVEKDVFLTSDRPVTFLDKTGRGGPGKPEIPVIFPLTPRRILIMDFGPGRPASDYADVADSDAALFNSALVMFCVNIVLTGRPVAEVLQELSSSP